MKRIIIFFLPVLLLIQSCKEVEYPIKLGGNYFLFHNPLGYTTIITTYREYVIYSEIVAWNFDSTFIIAKHKPYLYIMDSLQIEYPNVSTYNIRKKIYKEVELYNYLDNR